MFIVFYKLDRFTSRLEKHSLEGGFMAEQQLHGYMSPN